MAKVKTFSTDRLVEEFEWMAKNRIDLLYNCDANVGLLPRDMDWVKALVKTKEKYGYPKKFRGAYAKNSNEKVFQISKLLNDADMSKGTTLSFQSMDEETLRIVKRKNIQVTDFKALIKRYREQRIPTYSELIIGLPGESYDSFAKGINTLLEAGQHGSLNVYTCECLPNSEMSEPEYREKHGIQSVHTPQLFYHSTPSDDAYREYYDLVVETKTLSREDWNKCQCFAWIVQALHCLDPTQCIAVFLHHYVGISYREFYERLIRWASQHEDTVLGEAMDDAITFFIAMQKGETPEIAPERYGGITWPPEELGFLHVATHPIRFYCELFDMISDTWCVETFPLCDLIDYQRAVLKKPVDSAKEILTLECDIHECLQAAYLGDGRPITNQRVSYEIQREQYPSLKEYAKEVVWYGRKGGTMLNTHKVIRRAYV